MFSTPSASASGKRRARHTDAGSSRASGSQNGENGADASQAHSGISASASTDNIARRKVGAVNLATKQPSFAYGAAADDNLLGRPRRLGARGSTNSTSPSPGEGADSQGSQVKQEDSQQLQSDKLLVQAGLPSAAAAFERSAQPARARYAQLKAQKEAAAALAQEADAKRNRSRASLKSSTSRQNLDAAADDTLGSIASPSGVRRSARLSEAGSQAGGDDSHRESFLSEHTTHISETQWPPAGTIDEEVEAEEEEEEVRHSQKDQLAGAGAVSPIGRARGNGQVSAVYLRAADANGQRESGQNQIAALLNESVSPDAPGYRPRLSILPGAQKAAHDPFHFTRGASSEYGSGLGGEDSASYDYAAEDASARAMVDDSRAGESSRSWLGSFRSPGSLFGGNTSKSKMLSLLPPISRLEQNGSASPVDPKSTAAADTSGETQTGAARKQRRKVSRDNQSYRPDPNDQEEDSEDDVSDDGRKHTHRRRGRVVSGTGKNARDIGKEDRDVWMKGGRRKKGSSRRRKQGAEGFEEDSSDLSELDDEEEGGDVTLGATPDIEEDDSRSSLKSKTTKADSAAKRVRKGRRVVSSAPKSNWPSVEAIKARLFAPSGLALLSLLLLLVASALTPAPHGSVSYNFWDWMPQGFSQDRQAAFEMLPSDVQEVVTRLRKLEQSVNSLQGVDADVRGIRSELSRLRQDFSERLTAVETSSATTKRTIAALEKKASELRREIERGLDDAKGREMSLQDELGSLWSRLKEVESRPVSDPKMKGQLKEEAAEALQRRILAVEDSLQQTKRTIAQLESASTQAGKRQTALERRIDELTKGLPALMPVRVDPKTGHYHIEAGFWVELKKVLATKDSVKEGDQTSSIDLTSADTWKAFRRANAEALRAVVREEMIETSAKAKDTLMLGREEYRQLIASELSVVKAQMEQKFNANLDGVKDELWEKIRNTGDAYQTSGSLSKPAADKLKGLYAGESAVPLTLQDGSDGRGIIMAMIDAALEKYSADRIGMQDYALYSSGGRIVPSLTSPTYEVAPSTSWFSKLIPGLGAKDDVVLRGKPPVTAIYHDNSPGMCWPFPGEQGQLGVALSQSIVPTDFTFEHAPSSLVGAAISSAPRDISVWGLMQRPEDHAKFAQFRARMAESYEGEPLPSPPSDDYVFLGSYAFDASPNSRSIQTYPVPAELRALNIPTTLLRFRFTSNHGNPDFTCVYRVRVHGKSAS